MKRNKLKIYTILSLLVPALALKADQPNVIVIISDDAGYADWGFMNETISAMRGTERETNIPTPHLDALRDRGTLFTSAYTGMVCSPSRAALITGDYQNKVGYEFNIVNATGANARDGHYNEAELVFEHMKSLGYRTGAIGKWHIGSTADLDAANGLYGNRPERQGVDEFLGIWRGSREFDGGSQTEATRVLRETTIDDNGDVVNTIVENQEPWASMNFTNSVGQGAIDFITRNHDSPFFLYVAHTAPHTPYHDSPDIDDPRISDLTGDRKQYASMMITMDKEIGRLMDALDDPNGDSDTADSIRDNTYVIFINDNGGAKAAVNAPLRGSKGQPYEGGIRVPMLLAGPGVPAGATYDKVVHSIDITPTAYAAGGGTGKTFDGVNLLPYIDGTLDTDPHEYIAVRHGNKFGLRKGDWKLVMFQDIGAYELYNLAEDVRESNDLSATESEKLEELKRDLTALEVQWEKPRHTGITDVSSTINQQNQFTAIPPVSTTTTSTAFVSDLSLVGGDLRNGDFNTASGGSFGEISSWENIGTGDQTQTATNTNNAYDGTRNAIIAENAARTFGLSLIHI